MKTTKELFTEKKQAIQAIESINKQIAERELTFDEWVEHAEKTHYPDLCIGSGVLKSVVSTIMDETMFQRHEVIELCYLLDDINDVIDSGEPWHGVTPNNAEALKEELQKMNFGSVEIDW